MTLVMSCRDADGTIYMLGDSAISAGYEVRLLKRPKVICKALQRIEHVHEDGSVDLEDTDEVLLIGATGDCRILDIIEHECDLIQPLPEASPSRWVHTVFTETLSNALDRLSYWETEGGTRFLPHNSELLIAMRGHFFNYTNALQVIEYQEDFDAIGNGREIALGAMDALRSGLWGTALTVEQQLTEAARITAQRMGGVEPPFVLITTGADGKPRTEGKEQRISA